MRYYKITDDCGWTHCIAIADTVDVLLAPHTRAAEEITKSEYEKMNGELKNDGYDTQTD